MYLYLYTGWRAKGLESVHDGVRVREPILHQLAISREPITRDVTATDQSEAAVE